MPAQHEKYIQTTIVALKFGSYVNSFPLVLPCKKYPSGSALTKYFCANISGHIPHPPLKCNPHMWTPWPLQSQFGRAEAVRNVKISHHQPSLFKGLGHHEFKEGVSDASRSYIKTVGKGHSTTLGILQIACIITSITNLRLCTLFYSHSPARE